MWRPWFSTLREVITIISRFCLSAWGGQRLVAEGLRSLVHLSPHDSFTRKIYTDEAVTKRLALIAFAIYPTALSVGMATISLSGYCDPQYNAHRFWPPHTRDDIKDILESWTGLAMIHVRTGLSLQQMNRWRLSLGRAVVWGLGIATWVTVEIYMGPCWYFSRIWKVWFSVICVSFATWFIAHAQELIVKSRKSVGTAHLELLMYIGVVYIVRWVDVDGLCVKPTCW
ncbi:hypothetical protein GCG54_00008389 [Colletotrichum gloeosporioides]|uniref:Integral membrane protein n=1 Tax=Colletotrichum gloeosporioides TaxID=474922 RepID=A0A8H4CHK4_COLGL|nr:uncharacterized protein GCG54_00008389 [Colletotrichum gloeosporioides]KAF3803887.1 hypothetical protein GCG54_00008389 [Colletotrichum gloeosporioides]